MEVIKNISKIGNSHGVIFDKVIMETLKLKKGDKVKIKIEKIKEEK